MSSSTAWRHNDVPICDVVKQDVGGWRVNFSTFFNVKKIKCFDFWIGAQLAYKIKTIKFDKERWNLNTVKISFCKVAVPRIKFVFKDVEMFQKWLPYPYLAPYNTREED